MRRLALMIVAASLACAAPKPSPAHEPSKEPTSAGTNAEGDAEPPDDRPEATDPDDAAPADLDFSEDVATPSAAVSAPPQRRPSGAFDVCGGKCRDDIKMKKSLEGVDEE